MNTQAQKKNLGHRALATLLAVLMVVMMVPAGVFDVETEALDPITVITTAISVIEFGAKVIDAGLTAHEESKNGGSPKDVLCAAIDAFTGTDGNKELEKSMEKLQATQDHILTELDDIKDMVADLTTSVAKYYNKIIAHEENKIIAGELNAFLDGYDVFAANFEEAYYNYITMDKPTEENKKKYYDDLYSTALDLRDFISSNLTPSIYYKATPDDVALTQCTILDFMYAGTESLEETQNFAYTLYEVYMNMQCCLFDCYVFQENYMIDHPAEEGKDTDYSSSTSTGIKGFSHTNARYHKFSGVFLSTNLYYEWYTDQINVMNGIAKSLYQLHSTKNSAVIQISGTDQLMPVSSGNDVKRTLYAQKGDILHFPIFESYLDILIDRDHYQFVGGNGLEVLDAKTGVVEVTGNAGTTSTVTLRYSGSEDFSTAGMYIDVYTWDITSTSSCRGYIADGVETTDGTFSIGSGENTGKYKTYKIDMINMAERLSGSGEEEDPYLITTGNELLYIKQEPGKCYKLMNDINFGGAIFEDTTALISSDFTGTLDGNGYCITGFAIRNTTADNVSAVQNQTNNVGLFQSISGNGTVKNLVIGNRLGYYGYDGFAGYSVKIRFNANEIAKKDKITTANVGAICGVNQGTIQNSYVNKVFIEVDLNDKKNNNGAAICNVGGIAGKMTGGGINYCSVINSLEEVGMLALLNSGDDNIAHMGGIVGALFSGTVSNCVSFNNTLKGDVAGNGTEDGSNYAYPCCRVGGLVGILSVDMGTSRDDGDDISGFIKDSVSCENDLYPNPYAQKNEDDGTDDDWTYILHPSQKYGHPIVAVYCSDATSIENGIISWSLDFAPFDVYNFDCANVTNCYEEASSGYDEKQSIAHIWTYNDIEIISEPNLSAYYIGEQLNLSGLKVFANSLPVSGYTVSGFDSSTPGIKTVTVNWNGLKKSFTVFVCGGYVDEKTENTYWSFDADTGTLTIGGTGATKNFWSHTEARPWSAYDAQIKKVVFEEGITSIGFASFYPADDRYQNIETVVLPSTLETIGEYAFCNLKGLTSIKWSDGLKTIERRAFKDCTKLASIDLPDSLQTIGAEAFYQCSALTKVSLPSSLKTIGDRAFHACKNIEALTLPEGLTTIGVSAFYYNNSITKLEIPASVTSIGTGAFSAWKSLKEITVAAGNSSYCSEGDCIITKGDSKVLVTGCRSSVIPADIKEIASTAFYGIARFSGKSGVLEIPNGVTTIGTNAFGYCYDIKTLVLPSSVTSIGTRAFEWTTGLKSVYYKGTETEWEAVSKGDGWDASAGAYTMYYSNHKHSSSDGWKSDSSGHYHICEVCNETYDSAAHAWENACDAVCGVCNYHRDVEDHTNEWVKTADHHYQKCSACGVTTSAEDHTYDNACDTTCNTCGYTRTVSSHSYGAWVQDAETHHKACTICGTRTSLGAHSYDNDYDATCNDGCGYTRAVAEKSSLSLELTDVPTIYAKGSAVDFSKLVVTVTMTDDQSVPVTDYTVSEVSTSSLGIKTVTVEHDSMSATFRILVVDAVSTGGYLTDDTYWSFNSDTATLTIGGTGETTNFWSHTDARPWSAYDAQIKNVVFDEGITSIGYAFFYTGDQRYQSIETVSLPSTLETIGRFAFRDQKWLTSITLPEGLQTIEGSAFNGSGLLSLDVPNSVTSMGAWAVTNTPITSVTLGTGVTAIQTGTFASCTSLELITMQGDVISIGEQAFKNCTKLASIDLPDCLQTIGADAFYQCSALTTVPLPSSLRTIGDRAFHACRMIEALTLPEGLESIGVMAFYFNSGIKSLHIPASVTSIGEGAFSGWKSLGTITVDASNTTYHAAGNCIIETATGMLAVGCMSSVIPTDGSVKAIAPRAFYGIPISGELIIPNSVTSIGDRAFGYCRSVTKLVVPSSVTSIGKNAFEYMTGLKIAVIEGNNLALPNGLFAFAPGNGELYRNMSLEILKLSGTFTSIGSNALNYCIDLHTINYTGSETEWNAIEKDESWDKFTEGYEMVYGETHFPSHTWSKNDGVHYAVCSVCGEHVNESAHVYDNACDAICNVCDHTRDVSDHSYGEWVRNESTHHKACTGCGELAYVGDHYYTSDFDESCNDCGYIRVVTILPVLSFSDNEGRIGSTVTVSVDLGNNPGLSILNLTLRYDASALRLVSAENGTVISDFDMGLNLLWSADEDSSVNGRLVLLTFEILNTAEGGTYELSATINECCNSDGIDIPVVVNDGTIEATLLYGDVNGDGTINGRDVLSLRRYLVNLNYDTGVSTETVYAGADANGDGTINGRDLLALRKYMVNYDYDTGSSSVVLGPKA